MTYSIYIGVDPGAGGGVAAVRPGGAAEACAMPDTEQDLLALINRYAAGGPAVAVVERVGGFMGGKDDGGVKVNKASAHTMFRFGQNYGGLRMALTASRVPYDDVPPAKWQKALGIPPRGKTETRGQFKARLKQKAQQLFPGVKVTLATADALLLASYATRVFGGKVEGG